MGNAMVQLFEVLRYKPQGGGFDSQWVIDLILPVEVWPVFDSTSHRNEFKEYFLGGKDGRCVGMTTFMCRLS
jgi:hypothetical protein